MNDQHSTDDKEVRRISGRFLFEPSYWTVILATVVAMAAYDFVYPENTRQVLFGKTWGDGLLLAFILLAVVALRGASMRNEVSRVLQQENGAELLRKAVSTRTSGARRFVHIVGNLGAAIFFGVVAALLDK